MHSNIIHTPNTSLLAANNVSYHPRVPVLPTNLIYPYWFNWHTQIGSLSYQKEPRLLFQPYLSTSTYFYQWTINTLWIFPHTSWLPRWQSLYQIPSLPSSKLKNTLNLYQYLVSASQTYPSTAQDYAIYLLTTRKKLIETGAENIISRVLTSDTISEVSQYDFDMEELSVTIKHVKLPNN